MSTTNNKFKVITKHASKSFDEKILKLDNLNIVDLDHNELQSLKLKGSYGTGFRFPSTALSICKDLVTFIPITSFH